MSDLIQVFAQNQAFYLTSVTILGLCIGSFLNVVIYRLPVMMESQWKAHCEEVISEHQLPHEHTQPEQERFDLAFPASRCPHCGHKIKLIENIPILSYLLLGGKCSSCKTRISARYPAIELLTALLSLFVAWHFGFTTQAAGALLLTWSLIALSAIDFDTQLLPDAITLPLVWLGLFFNISGTFTNLTASVVGAMAGYLILWSIFHAFKLLTGKEGMGFGDFKLLAALGAWLGWQLLPVIILLSSFAGAIVGVSLIVLRQHQHEKPIPFGPYLAIAGWLALIWGEKIIQFYFSIAGIR